MKITKVKYDLIKPYWRNPRLNATTVEALKESIKKFGFRVPLILDEQDIIITGHARYKALGQLKGNLSVTLDLLKSKEGAEELIENLTEIEEGTIPVLYAKGLTQKQIKEYRISDNKISDLTLWDTEALNLELKELGSVIGFDPEEIANLIEIKDSDTNYDGYTSEDMNKKAEELKDKFNNPTGPEVVEIICPKCLDKFEMRKTDLLK